jgi:asparagine synthase (glutamine-hydrolysing)
MCGIAGRVTGGEPVDPHDLERMCDALLHRGPDGAGMYVEGPVALGMRRLAIVDLVTGDQPFHSEDGRVTVVGNGEIYNHQELRRDLQARGHRFRSGSDIEVIVHLWEELGPSCVTRLRGMFAFALWDEGERRLFLARDRMGRSPSCTPTTTARSASRRRCGRCCPTGASRATSTRGRSTRTWHAATSRTSSAPSRACASSRPRRG